MGQAAHVFVSADTRKKPLFGKQGKVLSLSHLDFDIVSTVRRPVEDLDIRISSLRDISFTPCPLPSVAYLLSSVFCHLFMQNKPNFRNDKMNVTFYFTKDYKYETNLRLPKKQTQTNPISKRRRIT